MRFVDKRKCSSFRQLCTYSILYYILFCSILHLLYIIFIFLITIFVIRNINGQPSGQRLWYTVVILNIAIIWCLVVLLFCFYGAVGRFQILRGQREKRALMKSKHTLGFLVSVFGRDSYFKYCKWVKNTSKSS